LKNGGKICQTFAVVCEIWLYELHLSQQTKLV